MLVGAVRPEVGALSETGYVRAENQDRMSGSEVPLGHLYIVADGMGGHNGGAIAAELAVKELQGYIGQASPTEPIEGVITAAFNKANEAVFQRAHSGDPAVQGMGTTAVLLLVSGRLATVAHIGDSRAYLYRNGGLVRLTIDHTVVQRMVDAGALSAEEAANHPDASVLERAVGSAPTARADVSKHDLQEGDAVLLCSDGLSGYVADDAIEAALRQEGTAQDMTERLVRLALERGGHDNVTVQVVKYGARPAGSRSGQGAGTTASHRAVAPGQPMRLRGMGLWGRTAMILGFAAVVVVSIVLLGRATGNTVVAGGVQAVRDTVSDWRTKLQGGTPAEQRSPTQTVSEADIAQLQRRLDDTTQRLTASIDGMQRELRELRELGGKARPKSEKDPADVARELNSIRADLRKEVQGMRAALEALGKRVRNVETSLPQADKPAPSPASPAASGNQESPSSPKNGGAPGGAADAAGAAKPK